MNNVKSFSLNKSQRSLLVVSLSLALGGAIYWSIPLPDIELLSRSFMMKWCPAAFFAGLTSFALTKKRPLTSSLLVTGGFTLAIALRAIFDVVLDPTSHNLWPVELAISAGTSFPAAFIGAIIASWVLKK